jgi:hypothetical protein
MLAAMFGALPKLGLLELGTDTGPPFGIGAEGVATDALEGALVGPPPMLDVLLDVLVEGGVGVEPGDAEEVVKRSFMTGGGADAR